MNLAKVKERLTLEEYNQISDSIFYKHDFIDGYIIKSEEEATGNHSIIIQNVSGILRQHLKGSKCRVFTSETEITINRNVLKPDIFVNCENLSLKNARFNDAILIVEVLSKGTKVYDRGNKFELYKQANSLTEYALIDQYKKCIIIYRKQENGSWTGKYYIFNMDIDFQSIELTVNINDIYEDVEF